VARVVAWRGRQFGRRAVDAFNRAARADGAHESGLTSLTYAVMFNYGSDAAMAVALANTLFFAAASAESKTKVALYLLITVAPFGLVAPVIGPILDKIQRGRRIALAAACLGSAFASVIMALHFQDWLLYPAALTQMVLSKSFTVLKAAVTPRVLPRGLPLVKTNARLTTFGLGATAAFGGIAAGITKLFGSPGALWFSALICIADAVLCMRIPSWVEVTEGEVPASVTTRLRRVGKSGRQAMGRRVVTALWGNGTIRVLTGFITLFAAFVVKAQTEHSPFKQVLLLGLVGVAGGAGSFLGNAVGSRMHVRKQDRMVLGCVMAALVSTILAAVLAGIVTATLVALVGAVSSALAKISLDAVIQDDLPEASRASAFGRSETILQLSWVFGGALGVLLPADFWIGFAVVSALLAIGLLQTFLCQLGSSLIPAFGGDHPIRPDAELRAARQARWGPRGAAPPAYGPPAYGSAAPPPPPQGPLVHGRPPAKTKTMPNEHFD